MCVRMCPLSFEEARDALEVRKQTGRARVKRADEFDADFDAYPGARVPTMCLVQTAILSPWPLRGVFRLRVRRDPSTTRA